MRGKQVVGKDGAARKITIAFRRRDGRFEVADAAIRRASVPSALNVRLISGRRG
jgi:hypothetical protein